MFHIYIPEINKKTKLIQNKKLNLLSLIYKLKKIFTNLSKNIKIHKIFKISKPCKL